MSPVVLRSHMLTAIMMLMHIIIITWSWNWLPRGNHQQKNMNMATPNHLPLKFVVLSFMAKESLGLTIKTNITRQTRWWRLSPRRIVSRWNCQSFKKQASQNRSWNATHAPIMIIIKHFKRGSFPISGSMAKTIPTRAPATAARKQLTMKTIV